MKRTHTKETPEQAGKKVKVMGWVEARRDMGKLIFIDVIDASGVLQTVFIPQNEELFKLAGELRLNDVIEIEGTIQERPASMANKEIETGKVELKAESLNILNKAATTPFELYTDGYEVDEEVRMKYRYLDLRRARLQKNIKARHKIIQYIRNFLTEKGFTEIETPILTKSTPEGARDYVVPSRAQNGKFYALPQSPQQYKQLLMVAGFEKYFQIARCFRDEDTRGDRQPEFTQLDMEMSFTEQEDIMKLNEELIVKIMKDVYSDKKISQIPFPRISHKESMEKYGTDRPDLRNDKNNPNEMAFCWVIDCPFFEKNKEGKWTFTHNPFSATIPEHREMLLEKKDIEKITAAQYDIVLNGFEIGGGSIRNHKPEALKKVLEIICLKEKDIEKNFGHMLGAFTFGAPPHGGIAFGLDRFTSILQNEPNIREVIAFPKTGDGRDLMMEAPSEIGEEQMKELGISAKKKGK